MPFVNCNLTDDKAQASQAVMGLLNSGFFGTFRYGALRGVDGALSQRLPHTCVASRGASLMSHAAAIEAIRLLPLARKAALMPATEARQYIPHTPKAMRSCM